MGEEGTEHRLVTLEEITKEQKKVLAKVSDEVSTIKLLNVKQDVTLNIIVWLAKALLTVFIGLIASNIWMYLDSR